ncbi:MAG: HAD hydrolase-like protein [Candidatus Saccharimonadales bacterium]
MSKQGRNENPVVILDFDGTIVDSLPAVIKVFEDISKHPRRFSPKQIEAFRNLSLPELANNLKIPKWKIPWLLFRGRRMMRSHLRSIKIHPGMEDAIKKLDANSIKLYILSSNSEQNVRKYLQWHGLDRYFLGIYGGAGLLGKAPKLAKLVKRERIVAGRTWYIGDETRDVLAAKTVGLHSGAVTWGYNTSKALVAKDPERIFNTPIEIVKAIV